MFKEAGDRASEQIPSPVDSSQLTLVDQLVQWARRRVDERVFRPGMRMPSIRKLSADKGVSRFTVVEAYERLVALGCLESRRGSGFFVREQPAQPPPGAPRAAVRSSLDVVWLLRNMLHTTSHEKSPGLGFLPNQWLDGDLLANAMRSLSRQNSKQLLGYGSQQGFLPLRRHLQTRLAEFEIGAAPEQILMVSGITQALDLIVGLYVQAGDTVVVGDPAWFHMFGRFVSQGARLVGMPYTPDGPDLDALEALVKSWRPRLLVINSVLHNPTGTSLSAAQAHRLLRLADEYDFVIVEDDIYGDLCPPTHPATRLASLDQLRRVIYLGSFSKTLAANLRVGYLAAAPETAAALADQKMLVGMTTPEINERLVFKALTEGHYRRHVERLRERLEEVREPTMRALEGIGLRFFCRPTAGMFLWADTGVDTAALASAAAEEGMLLAPGSLFSPNQTPSTWMRLNLANCSDPALLAWLAARIQPSSEPRGRAHAQSQASRGAPP